MFYDNFVKLCASINKRPSAVALEIGINKSTVSNWKMRGTHPTDSTLQMIADYFDITVDELLSENENKPAPDDGNELTDVQREALKLIHEMSDDQLRVFIATLKAARGE